MTDAEWNVMWVASKNLEKRRVCSIRSTVSDMIRKKRGRMAQQIRQVFNIVFSGENFTVGKTGDSEKAAHRELFMRVLRPLSARPCIMGRKKRSDGTFHLAWLQMANVDEHPVTCYSNGIKGDDNTVSYFGAYNRNDYYDGMLFGKPALAPSNTVNDLQVGADSEESPSQVIRRLYEEDMFYTDTQLYLEFLKRLCQEKWNVPKLQVRTDENGVCVEVLGIPPHLEAFIQAQVITTVV